MKIAANRLYSTTGRQSNLINNKDGGFNGGQDTDYSGESFSCWPSSE